MLTNTEQQVLNNIDQYGYTIMHVAEAYKGDVEEPGFSYSIGLYKTYQLPEIIIVGLDQELRHTLIENICQDYQDGNALKVPAYNAGIVDGYNCLVVEVEQSNYVQYLPWAIWFHKSLNFPAVQVIYPNLVGYFPWDEAFPKHIIQPILNEKYSQGLP